MPTTATARNERSGGTRNDKNANDTKEEMTVAKLNEAKNRNDARAAALAATEFETVLYREENGVAWITLNRPEVLNAFNRTMMREMQTIWEGLRDSGTVRCVVITAAGERAFCTGVDRHDFLDEPSGFESEKAFFDVFSRSLGPRSNEMWIPVIAAVRGMACGGAFYMLGEADFIIASDDATFFDPHVTTGIVPIYESIHMLQKMPFSEIMRLSLLGNHERMSAKRAHEIGLVSEVVPGSELLERALGRRDHRLAAGQGGAGHGAHAVAGALDGSRRGADGGAHADRELR
jgi:enoyl-CoA hydratase/carnithine racemase